MFRAASGTTAADSSGGSRDGTCQGGGFTYGAATPPCDSSAVTFNASASYTSTPASLASPTNFTIETWFRTSTTTGGTLIGFAANQTDGSGPYDRHIILGNNGKLSFGVYDSGPQVLTTTAGYNDGAAMSETTGGALRGRRNPGNERHDRRREPRRLLAYRIHNMDGVWGSYATNAFFAGSMSHVAIYQSMLNSTRISAHYNAGL